MIKKIVYTPQYGRQEELQGWSGLTTDNIIISGTSEQRSATSLIDYRKVILFSGCLNCNIMPFLERGYRGFIGGVSMFCLGGRKH